MNSMQIKFAALALSLLTPVCFAESHHSYDYDDGYHESHDFESLYAGMGLGNVNITNKCSEYALNCDEEGLFYGAYAGIRPSKFWSVEVGFKSTTDFYFETNYPYEAHLSLVSASVLFYLPLSPQFEFFLIPRLVVFQTRVLYKHCPLLIVV